MYYRLESNGNIIECSLVYYGSGCLKTDRAIIRDLKGQLVFEDEIDIKALEKEKKALEFENDRQKYLGIVESRLQESDYKCLKFVDGALSESEYASIRAEREKLRLCYNELEIVKTKTKLKELIATYNLDN